MKYTSSKSNPSLVLAYGGTLVTLTVWTGFFDPFVFPKYILLVTLGIYSLLSISIRFRTLGFRNNLLYILTATVFIVLAAIATLRTEVKFTALHGVQGRNMGLLSFLSLFCVTIAVAMSYTRGFEKQASYILLSTAFVSSLYGSSQGVGLDPFKWVLQFEGIVGTFGNPNFMSAFSAIGAITSFGLLALCKPSKNQKSFIFATLILSIVCISLSKSTQGWAMLFIGVSPLLIIIVQRRISGKNHKSSFLNVSRILFFPMLLAIMAIVLFSGSFTQNSFGMRLDFWGIAIRMIQSSPIFGIGVERYQNYYREFRTLEEAKAFGSETFSDSAHNIFLNLAATMGLPVAITYLIFNVLVLFTFIRIFNDLENREFLVILFSVWIAIQAQSLISVEYPSIIYWLHFISGIAIGAHLKHSNEKKNSAKVVQEHRFLIFGNQSLAILSVAISILFVFPLILAQSQLQDRFFLIIDSKNQQQVNAKQKLLLEVEELVPGNPEYPLLSANSLFQDGAFPQAASAAERAILLDSHDYRSWWFLSSSLEAQEKWRESISPRKRAIELSPHSLDDLVRLAKSLAKLGDRDGLVQVARELNVINPDSKQFQEVKLLIESVQIDLD